MYSVERGNLMNKCNIYDFKKVHKSNNTLFHNIFNILLFMLN